jgi:hypothetical protein
MRKRSTSVILREMQTPSQVPPGFYTNGCYQQRQKITSAGGDVGKRESLYHAGGGSVNCGWECKLAQLL